MKYLDINAVKSFSIATICLLLLLNVGCASTQEVQPPTVEGRVVDLSGNWEVDFKLTENAQEKLLFLYEIARSQIRQQQNRRDTTESIGGRQAVQASIDDLNNLIKLGSLADSMNQSNVLRIEQGEDYILIKREDDFALNCEFGSLEVTQSFGQEWCGFDRNGKLLFISRLPQGLDIVHEFTLSDNTQRMSVSTSVRTPALRNAYTINRIYMPFEQGEGLYNCEFTLEKKKTCWLGSPQETTSGAGAP